MHLSLQRTFAKSLLLPPHVFNCIFHARVSACKGPSYLPITVSTVAITVVRLSDNMTLHASHVLIPHM